MTAVIAVRLKAYKLLSVFALFDIWQQWFQEHECQKERSLLLKIYRNRY